MKVVLFCTQPYTFSILYPLVDVLKARSYEYIWFNTKANEPFFPYPDEPNTSDLRELRAFKSDVLFAPGNTMPHFLRGLKVQVFHGLAGEKASHFKIRHYYDLYLTQGPYFTSKFLELKSKYKDFDVIETGWSKLDIFAKNKNKYDVEKAAILQRTGAEKLVLFAPTHNSSMNSAPFLVDEFKTLASISKYVTIVKFHDLTSPDVIQDYSDTFADNKKVIITNESDITKFLLMADILVSDTSSVVYEFQLLDKPVVTFKTQATHILWDNADHYSDLAEHIRENLEEDKYAENRARIISEYHPYHDGKSSERMIDAAEATIRRIGVPKRRKVPLKTKFRIFKLFYLRNKKK